MLRLFTGLVVLGVIAGWMAYYILSRSLVDYDEDFTVRGITAPVEIVRNNDNVPHIFGATDEDVFFALGFAHAQDRLWQMTMLRRTAQGAGRKRIDAFERIGHRRRMERRRAEVAQQGLTPAVVQSAAAIQLEYGTLDGAPMLLAASTLFACAVAPYAMAAALRLAAGGAKTSAGRA